MTRKRVSSAIQFPGSGSNGYPRRQIVWRGDPGVALPLVLSGALRLGLLLRDGTGIDGLAGGLVRAAEEGAV